MQLNKIGTKLFQGTITRFLAIVGALCLQSGLQSEELVQKPITNEISLRR